MDEREATTEPKIAAKNFFFLFLRLLAVFFGALFTSHKTWNNRDVENKSKVKLGENCIKLRRSIYERRNVSSFYSFPS